MTYSAAFTHAVDFVLSAEGGYVNDAHDPGGETKYGISQRAYPATSIATLTEDDARFIYHRDYWMKMRCEEMPPKAAICAFDAAVNQGRRHSTKLLQRAVRVKTDGRLGPITIAAIGRANPEQLVLDLLSHRLRSYAFTRNARRYMRGWSRRVLDLHAHTLQPMPNPRPDTMTA